MQGVAPAAGGCPLRQPAGTGYGGNGTAAGAVQQPPESGHSRLFNSHPKADIAVELVKKYEGLHDRSDYPYYGYGHRRLPNEKLSYGMTEAEALLRKDLAVRYRLFRKYGKDALLLTVLSYNVGQGVLLGHGGHIYREYTAYCRYKGKTVRSIERRRKMEFLLLYEP